jgi:hypothetical protein
VLAAVVFAAGVASGSAAPASGPHKLTLYSVAEQEQYINNSDSLARGVGSNPFGNYKDLAPLATKNANGPFPGDEALFSFNLYSDANLKSRAGSAVFTCQYNFNKNAYCDASFQLVNGGTLVASGAFNFAATSFTLAVTGGYGRYLKTTGSMVDTPTAKHAQKLRFRFD